MGGEPLLHERLFRFALVGGLAALVDMAVVEALVATGGGLYGSRVVSYLAAATVAWWLNRRFTFYHRRSRGIAREWGRYLLANLVGGVVNYAVYAALVSSFQTFARYPFLAVAVGSLAGMLINFAMSQRFVFQRP